MTISGKAQDFESLHDRDAFERSCAGKDPYPSLSAAEAAIKALAKAGQLNRVGSMNAYHCRFGDHYHFGHLASTAISRSKRRT